MSGNEERKISSLRDLPRDLAPPRDLWQGIEARIAADKSAASTDGRAGPTVPTRRLAATGRLGVLAAAAVIVALAVGIWIGRSVLPVPGGAVPGGGSGLSANSVTSGEPGAFHAAYVMDTKYIQQRAALVKDLESRLAALPPDSRAKVVSSLQTINDSKRDLERELGKDPSNALLQELLVNTYQDEMRVLTAVHEAGSSGEGI
ncbi:MAG: hypothetical protein QOI59_5447 [Gammaproteobacteria bacterium]|jgi:hypothetical protein|nr:hypothetical protein [Gammaproteobacteria bacterium]